MAKAINILTYCDRCQNKGKCDATGAICIRCEWVNHFSCPTWFKPTEEPMRSETCSQCEHFTRVYSSMDGICHKGHGCTEATAQGLPKPEQGTGYVPWFDHACWEDYVEATP